MTRLVEGRSYNIKRRTCSVLHTLMAEQALSMLQRWSMDIYTSVVLELDDATVNGLRRPV